MAEIPALWSVIVNLTALFTSGITFNDGYIQINYAKGLSFHTAIAEPEKVAKFQINQSPFQRLFKKCTVSVYFGSEISVRHTVKAIPVDDAKKILDTINSYL